MNACLPDAEIESDLARELRAARRAKLAEPATEEAVVREAWAALNLAFPGDPFGDWQDALYDELSRRGTAAGLTGLWLPQHQKRGEDIPAQNTEQGLTWLRNTSRLLCASSEYAVSALENRVNYIVSTGLVHRAAPAKPTSSPTTVRDCQALIDLFAEYVDLPDLEQETCLRTDIDGDAILRLWRFDGGRMEVRFVEPEHLRSPDGSGQGDRRTSYGVETPENDAESVLAYHVVEHPDTNATVRVPARDVLHMRGGRTFRSSKRGRPLFYAVFNNLRRVEQIGSALAAIARARAKIALIRKLKGGTESSAEKLREKVMATTVTDPVSGKQRTIEDYKDGSIITSGENVSYEMPGANLGAGDFIEVLKFHLRGIAAAVNMPEWMLTSNAEDMGAYTAAMVAESPSTRGFQRAQRKFRQFFAEGRMRPRQALLWRYLDHCADCGLLERRALAEVQLTAEAPTLVVRDEAGEATTNKTYHDLKVKSVETIQMEQGLDPEVERERLAKEQPAAPAAGEQAPAPGAAPESTAPRAAVGEPKPEGDAGGFELQITEAAEHEAGALRVLEAGDYTGAAFGRYFVKGKAVSKGEYQSYAASQKGKGGGKGKKPAEPPPLPKKAGKLTAAQAAAALAAKGYKLGKGEHDLESGKTLYAVTFPGGKAGHLTAGQVKDLVYGKGPAAPADPRANADLDAAMAEPPAKPAAAAAGSRDNPDLDAAMGMAPAADKATALQRGQAWAAGQADANAGRVATHLGLDGAQAKAKLADAIRQAVAAAVEKGAGTVTLVGPNGKRLKVTVRHKPGAVREAAGADGEFDAGLEFLDAESPDGAAAAREAFVLSLPEPLQSIVREAFDESKVKRDGGKFAHTAGAKTGGTERADGGYDRQPGAEYDAKPKEAHVWGEVHDALPDEVKADHTVVGKVRKLASAAYEVVWGFLAEHGPGLVPEILDTADDYAKISYSKAGAQGQAQHDPFMVHLGVPYSAVSVVLSKVIGAAYGYVKGKTVKEALEGLAPEDREKVAAAVADLFKRLWEAWGVQAPAPTAAAVLARLMERIAGD